MGEASDYERMFDELAAETQHRNMAEAKERRDMAAVEEARYSALPANNFQCANPNFNPCPHHRRLAPSLLLCPVLVHRPGCPFKIKDVVRCKLGNAMEGKVVGLPTVEEAQQTSPHAHHAWMHWSDSSRSWVKWSELVELRRSPPSAKRPHGEASTLMHSMHSRFSQPTLMFGHERRAAWAVTPSPPPPPFPSLSAPHIATCC